MTEKPTTADEAERCIERRLHGANGVSGCRGPSARMRGWGERRRRAKHTLETCAELLREYYGGNSVLLYLLLRLLEDPDGERTTAWRLLRHAGVAKGTTPLYERLEARREFLATHHGTEFLAALASLPRSEPNSASEEAYGGSQ